MTSISIEGDLSNLGDAALTAANCDPTVTFEGKAVAVVNGASVPVHNHGDSPKVSAPSSGSATVTISGDPVHRVGDARSCGTHVTAGESRTVNIFT
jgi:uncharacterized Zn-binding protein involved in type VI secretion